MAKLVTTLLVWPWKEQATVAVPPVSFDSMCQLHPTTPLLCRHPPCQDEATAFYAIWPPRRAAALCPSGVVAGWGSGTGQGAP
jgi:hypothetical protein